LGGAPGDMPVRLTRILTSTTTEEQDAHNLSGMEPWRVHQWAALDTTPGQIAAALAYRIQKIRMPIE
jgi:hypothetical protein